MKKLRKFLKSKGGLWAVIGTTAFILIIPIALLISWGIQNNWDWVLLGSYFTNEYAITCYIAVGLFLFLMFMLFIYSRLKEDI